jgi:hypothetical protein
MAGRRGGRICWTRQQRLGPTKLAVVRLSGGAQPVAIQGNSSQNRGLADMRGRHARADMRECRSKSHGGQVARKRLALYNFGIFRKPSDDPANQGFHDRNEPNFLAAEAGDGFIARSGYDGDPGPESWGRQVFPRFYVERGDGSSPSTLSLWEDLSSPMAFAYSGIHAEALKHGRQWFLKPAWPPYVLWWVDCNHTPTWQEGVARHEFLHDNGASAFAFDFKSPFDEDGNPTTIDRTAIERKMLINARNQERLT